MFCIFFYFESSTGYHMHPLKKFWGLQSALDWGVYTRKFFFVNFIET
jgi:hypothetical protein